MAAWRKKRKMAAWRHGVAAAWRRRKWHRQQWSEGNQAIVGVARLEGSLAHRATTNERLSARQHEGAGTIIGARHAFAGRLRARRSAP
jgi:hypothetical protein